MMAMSQKAGAMAAQVRKGTIHAVLCQNLYHDDTYLNPKGMALFEPGNPEMRLAEDPRPPSTINRDCSSKTIPLGIGTPTFKPNPKSSRNFPNAPPEPTPNPDLKPLNPQLQIRRPKPCAPNPKPRTSLRKTTFTPNLDTYQSKHIYRQQP